MINEYLKLSNDLWNDCYDEYIDVYDEENKEVISIGQNFNHKTYNEKLNVLYDEYLTPTINKYVLWKRNDHDKPSVYRIVGYSNLNNHIEVYLHSLQRNFKSGNTTKKYINRGQFKLSTIENIKRIKGWHESNLFDYHEKYLYVFKNSINRVKIGQAINVEHRMKAIMMMGGIELICINKIPNAARFETLLHQKYKEHRLFGEWFNLTNDQINYLENISLDDLNNEFK